MFVIKMDDSFASFSSVKSIGVGILETLSSKRAASCAKGRDWRKETISFLGGRNARLMRVRSRGLLLGSVRRRDSRLLRRSWFLARA